MEVSPLESLKNSNGPHVILQMAPTAFSVAGIPGLDLRSGKPLL